MFLCNQLKQQLAENDAIQSETVGQAYLEEYALKFFIAADNKDRAAQFDKYVFFEAENYSS